MVKRDLQKTGSEPLSLKKAKADLKKKQLALEKAKSRYKTLAGEYIDQWLKVNRIKKKLKLM